MNAIKQISLIFLILFFFSCTTKNSLIKGKLSLPDNAVVNLIPNRETYPILHGQVKSGEFILNSQDLPEGIYMLHVEWPNRNMRPNHSDYKNLFTSVRIYLEPKKEYFIYSKLTDTSIIKNLTIMDKNGLPLMVKTNSNHTMDLNELDIKNEQINADYKFKQDSLIILADLLLEQNEMKRYYAVVNENQSLLRDYFKSEVLKSVSDFISSRPSSAITPYLICTAPDLTQKKLFYESALKRLDPKLLNNRYTLEAKKRLSAIRSLKDGDVLPKIAGEDVNSNRVEPEFGSKYTLVEFWASWCAPCRAANPEWRVLHDKYRDKGLRIIGISFDTSRDRWKQAIEADKINWQHISDLMPMNESENSIRFNVTVVPSNYLLDKDRKIIAINLSPADLTKRLLQL